MTDSPASDWYLKTDGAPRGPVSLDTLIHWAATGGLDGASELAHDPGGPWASATEAEELELDWQVRDEQGNLLPPCHILALRSRVENDRVQPYWDIVHLPSGEVYDVVDALCSALLAQNHILEEKLAGLKAAEQTAPLPEGTNQDLRIQTDTAEREALKWRHLYEGEVERNETREQELQQQIDELRGSQRKASERIKTLERRRGQLEEVVIGARNAEVEGGDVDVLRGYRELQLQMENLLESLNLRNRQLDRARAELHESRLDLRKERQQHLAREEDAEELHQEALDQLNRLEHAHADLTRAYRDLNDRVVRLSNREAPSTAPAEDTPPSSRTPPAEKDDAPAGGASGPSKLKMT